MMRFVFVSSLSILLSGAALAQESYWIANRGSSDVMEVDAIGRVLQTVPMGTSLRSAHLAPDGKVWVVRFIQSSVDILNPNGTSFTTITFSMGSAFDIAFDAAGHAWISGGTGVEEFDANGVSLGTFPLSTGAPLGITVDAQGNKWIAHRIAAPGSVSRIDAVTGIVTQHPLAANSGTQPTRIVADSRGLGQPSHIWVVGDGGGSLSELDAQGNVVNTTILNAGGNLGSIVCDVDPTTFAVKYVWVGDFRNGDIWRYDVATGTPTLFTFGPDTIGLAMDGFQNLWQTSRGVTMVRRLDAASPFIEVETLVGSGVQSSLATLWQHATVVDPNGDLDGDQVPNFLEVQNLSSPFDRCSVPTASLSVEGSSQINMPTALQIIGSGQTAIAFGTAKAGTPIRVPGVACAFEIDPASVFPFSVGVMPPATVNLTIPNNPALVGNTLFVQGLNSSGGGFRFTNVTGWNFF